ncbi:MAG: lysophospholipid acyltransferase family protein [bacterium]
MARPLQKIKNHLIYFGVRLLLLFLSFLPRSWAAFLGRAFGGFFAAVAGGERRKTLRNLQIAFPGKSNEALARAVWTALGEKIFETARWLKWPSAKIASQVARVEGWENLEKALTRGKGVFLVTAHLGNWELLAAALAARHPTSAVAQKLYDPRFDRLVTDFREKHLGVSMIKRGMALRGILEALRENRIVIVLCDQDSGKDGIFVPFFGKAAWTQSGTARIALKTGASLVPAFVIRAADGLYELRVEKEIPAAREREQEKAVRETTRRYTEVIENYARAYPDQWVWMHERWKTRPPDEKA